ncbi:DUF84 family protein [Caldibacillus lycopersici]|uniref:inosine/xanthosine triphosphatase n=1 Tax=Perspicuibacillus lycopersici TaxID=1325689 RepID=A0AAE3LN37_9BACI|nr:DUF84 family protein [Perspicuibacillus lycopersici]MCU9614245.1 DUF84 family protein [Perspicuibacillus lycopersici]
MKIAVGTTNEAKLQAIQNVFSLTDSIFECKVASNVSEQPFSDEETITGAINRANNALLEVGGDIGIGLEGGVTETSFGLMLCNWGALVQADNSKAPIIAGGARIILPEEISTRLRNGEELGPVMDDFCQKENIRFHDGAIGIFTNGQINRILMFTQVVQSLKGQFEYQITNS